VAAVQPEARNSAAAAGRAAQPLTTQERQYQEGKILYEAYMADPSLFAELDGRGPPPSLPRTRTPLLPLARPPDVIIIDDGDAEPLPPIVPLPDPLADARADIEKMVQGMTFPLPPAEASTAQAPAQEAPPEVEQSVAQDADSAPRPKRRSTPVSSFVKTLRSRTVIASPRTQPARPEQEASEGAPQEAGHTAAEASAMDKEPAQAEEGAPPEDQPGATQAGGGTFFPK
jgi:hypothetical protein